MKNIPFFNWCFIESKYTISFEYRKDKTMLKEQTFITNMWVKLNEQMQKKYFSLNYNRHKQCVFFIFVHFDGKDINTKTLLHLEIIPIVANIDFACVV